MKKLVRFGVSLDHHLLDAFDQHIERRKYTNRSEALRDLIRDNLVGQEWDQNKETVGPITFVYDHHERDLTSKLTDRINEYRAVYREMRNTAESRERIVTWTRLSMIPAAMA